MSIVVVVAPPNRDARCELGVRKPVSEGAGGDSKPVGSLWRKTGSAGCLGPQLNSLGKSALLHKMVGALCNSADYAAARVLWAAMDRMYTAIGVLYPSAWCGRSWLK